MGVGEGALFLLPWGGEGGGEGSGVMSRDDRRARERKSGACLV